jgi:putative GTP pyrophosphokinase
MSRSSPSKSEIDRLGGRLRVGISPDDLRMLDEYRQTFASAYQEVLQAVREKLGSDVSGRPAKSTTAIVDKLKRESIRLSQMQDIAGCRITVENTSKQDNLVAQLIASYPDALISDRRNKPSHGYRAIHLIVNCNGHSVEIQIRTQLQHLWAELSEKSADKFGIDVKYGGGKKRIRNQLNKFQAEISMTEALEDVFPEHYQAQQQIKRYKQDLRQMMLEFLKIVEDNNDLPD